MNNIHYRDNIIKFRRDLHRIPELGTELPKTTKYILDYLDKLPCEITKIDEVGFTAFFDAGKDTTIAFRTDMDALPIEETTGLDFCSEHEGKMHACGHDGHMSVMLAFASEVSGMLQRINSNALMVFQAAEETTGGAYDICKSGIFEKYNTKEIYGLHIWPEFPANTVVCRSGPFMAGTKVLWINIEGKSSHIAKPEEGIDALDIGAKLVQEIYRIEREDFPKELPRILKFGEFNSGTGVNILSEKTYIGGTTRFYDNETVNAILNKINNLCESYEKEYGCTIDFKQSKGYPPVINPEHLVDKLKAVVSQIDEVNKYGKPVYFPLEIPLLPAEDFAQYQQIMPGLFFFLGTGMDLSLHNGTYDINEEVLPIGVEIFKSLLLRD